MGSALLRQIKKQTDFRVQAITRSQSMLLDDSSAYTVIIDCTASKEIAARYVGWLERGIHVITPNKKAFSGTMADYRKLKQAAKNGSSHCLYEATVGAGLPIISTLRNLIDTGDVIRSVRGILSGTLAYLFNVYDGSVPFWEIVRKAKERGYTEPDPRDDLSGMDVSRKLTILAREMGQTVEVRDFPVQNLISMGDHEMLALYEDAKDEGKVLRYVARITGEEVSAGLEAVAANHPFSNINLTDNIVQFETDRYPESPLVIQGPGAGAEVTAGGVFSDLLRLAKYLEDRNDPKV